MIEKKNENQANYLSKLKNRWIFRIQIDNQEKICRIAIYEYFACKVSSKSNYECSIERYRG